MCGSLFFLSLECTTIRLEWYDIDGCQTLDLLFMKDEVENDVVYCLPDE